MPLAAMGASGVSDPAVVAHLEFLYQYLTRAEDRGSSLSQAGKRTLPLSHIFQ